MRPGFTVLPAMFAIACVGAGIGWTPTAFGQTTAVREAGESVLGALAKFAARRGGKKAASELAEFGGEAAVRRLAQRALQETGEEGVERIARLAAEHGASALRALDNAPGLRQALGALDDLPARDVGRALARLAAGAEGRALASAVQRFGAEVLRAELRHPGLAAPVVEHLGRDGLDLLTRLGSEEALHLARHAPDLARLPPSTTQQVLRLMGEHTSAFFRFVGRFVEKNPGKVLFTAATTAVLISESERILGGDEIVLDADGNPVVVSKPGLIGRAAASGERMSAAATWGAAGFSAIVLAALGCGWMMRRRS